MIAHESLVRLTELLGNSNRLVFILNKPAQKKDVAKKHPSKSNQCAPATKNGEPAWRNPSQKPAFPPRRKLQAPRPHLARPQLRSLRHLESKV